MTPDEIADAQRELLARLDPKLVQFLREKRARPRTNVKKIITGGSQVSSEHNIEKQLMLLDTS